MISQSVEYSLRAMVVLASRYNEPMTVEQISEVAQIPRPYLSKIMQSLVRADLVRSQRGRGGGFVLTKQPKEIEMWDVVNAVDPIKRIHTCPLDIKGHVTLCALHRQLDQALALLESAFHELSLQELVEDCGDESPLCTKTPTLQIDPPRKKKSKKNRRAKKH